MLSFIDRLNSGVCNVVAKHSAMHAAVLDFFAKLPAYFVAAFVDAPAAAKHHQNYAGGLLEHSLKLAVALNDDERFQRYYSNADDAMRSAVVIGLCHDLCKVGLYAWSDELQKYTYDIDAYKHHALRSIELCAELGVELDQAQRVAILLHMGGIANGSLELIRAGVVEPKGWSNIEDQEALSASDWQWLRENASFVTAVCDADMSACH